MIFRVWSPVAARVEVELNGARRLPMHAVDGGWWQLSVDDVEAEVDYAFVVDGNGPFPDPRSPWQPHGVHGASRTLDHAAFAWTDQGWQAGPLAAAVVYELHVGTFTPQGTFTAAIDKLDYLVDLGVTHVELMPVAAFPGTRGWGYDGVALYAPHAAYGGPAGLKTLVDACHQRGLAVILDVVYNHLGPDGNYLNVYGPYFTAHHKTAWGDAVNLDSAGSDEVRRFFVDNACMWLRDYHIDALRLDAVHALIDDSAIHFLEELAVAVDRLEIELGRHLSLIAESDLNNPRLIQSRAVGGYGLDAQWSDEFHHALHVTLTGERAGYYVDFHGLHDVATALKQAYVHAGDYSVFRDRRHGRSIGDLPGYRFLGYLQNHDQIGNRARGERMHHLAGLDRCKIGAALVLTAPFVPMLFMGEEWAASSPFQYFTHFEDHALGEAVSAGRRNEFAAFGWDPTDVPDPQARETFQRSQLNWSELTASPHAEMLAWYRALLCLRRQIPALGSGSFDRVAVHQNTDAQWIVVDRGGAALFCNLAPHPQTIPWAQGGTIRLSSREGVHFAEGGVVVPGEGVAVVVSDW